MPSVIRHKLLAAILLFSCFSCEVDTVSKEKDTEAVTAPPAPAFVTYTIRQGEHATNSPLKFVNAAVVRFEATFDSSAVYRTALPSNQADINKLYGISDCGTDHHTNSARFGWRWYQDRLEIHAYTYHNKKRNTAYIGSVVIGQPAVYELVVGEKDYTFRINNQQVVLPRFCSGAAGGYQLYPYFGGDEKAPHDISIRVRELL